MFTKNQIIILVVLVVLGLVYSAVMINFILYPRERMSENVVVTQTKSETRTELPEMNVGATTTSEPEKSLKVIEASKNDDPRVNFRTPYEVFWSDEGGTTMYVIGARVIEEDINNKKLILFLEINPVERYCTANISQYGLKRILNEVGDLERPVLEDRCSSEKEVFVVPAEFTLGKNEDELLFAVYDFGKFSPKLDFTIRIIDSQNIKIEKGLRIG